MLENHLTDLLSDVPEDARRIRRLYTIRPRHRTMLYQQSPLPTVV